MAFSTSSADVARRSCQYLYNAFHFKSLIFIPFQESPGTVAFITMVTGITFHFWHLAGTCSPE